MCIAGVDLSGTFKRPSGLSIIKSFKIYLKHEYFLEDIIKTVLSHRVEIVTIDSPLTIPRKGAFRDVDRMLIRQGLRVLPILFSGMKMLTYRGFLLRTLLENSGILVIEVHPTSSLKIIGIERKNFINYVKGLGYEVVGKVSNHTVDALVSAFTAMYFLNNLTVNVQGKEGRIVLPVKRYPRIAVDGLVVKEMGGKKCVLLVQRRNPPFKGYWALPGGFVEYGETVEEAVKREVYEETGLETEVLKLIGVYSDPNRDPRWHVISIAFLLKPVGGELKAGSDAVNAKFFCEIPEEIAFDHKKIISDGLKIYSGLLS